MKILLFRMIGMGILLFWFPAKPAAEPVLYQYTDENGVVTYTNKKESVPEETRESIRPIERSDLPPLLTKDQVYFQPGQGRTDPWYRYWLHSYWFKTIVGLGILTLLSFMAVHFGAGSILLRVTGKLLLIIFIGASVYSLYLANQFTAYQKIRTSPTPDSQKVSPIERAAQSADAMEKKIHDQEELLRSME